MPSHRMPTLDHASHISWLCLDLDLCTLSTTQSLRMPRPSAWISVRTSSCTRAETPRAAISSERALNRIGDGASSAATCSSCMNAPIMGIVPAPAPPLNHR
eukprot:6172976-Pleurochrysis_carterae.AAC.2